MMTKILHLIDNIPVVLLLLVALTLGLAPFVPEPHLWEKLKMLGAGTLSKPIDIFDLLFHATPWIVLLLKLVRVAYLKRIDH
ncbi:RND transporter [Candidatus Thiothrix anitrata]|nr:RND transporter [Candidatus Thiothrix anitrata]